MNTKKPLAEPRPGSGPDRSPFYGRTVLRVSEVATHLNVTNEHVIALIDEGLLPAVNVGLRQRKFWRVLVRDLEAFLERREL